MKVSQKNLNEAKIKIFKSLANPTRLDLVRKLARQPRGESCGQLCSRTMFSQPTMSHHFAKLVDAGVFVESKYGTEKNYRLNTKALEAIGINVNKLVKGA